MYKYNKCIQLFFKKKLGLVLKKKKKICSKKNNCSETTLDKNKVCIKKNVKKIVRSEKMY